MNRSHPGCLSQYNKVSYGTVEHWAPGIILKRSLASKAEIYIGTVALHARDTEHRNIDLKVVHMPYVCNCAAKESPLILYILVHARNASSPLTVPSALCLCRASPLLQLCAFFQLFLDVCLNWAAIGTVSGVQREIFVV